MVQHAFIRLYVPTVNLILGKKFMKPWAKGTDTTHVRLMVRFVFSCILLASFVGVIAKTGKCMAETELEAQLLRAVSAAHDRLVQSTEHVAGELKIIRKEGDASREETIRFAKDGPKLRLEYSRLQGPPQAGPEWAKKERSHIVREIFIHSGKRFYHLEGYLNENSGVLYYSDFEDAEFRVRCNSDFLYWLTILYRFPETSVLDLLQRPIAKVETRPWREVPNALWITGKPMVSEEGTETDWTVVLNPDLLYAAVFYEFQARNATGGVSLRTSCEIEPQRLGEDTLLPRRVLRRAENPGKTPTEWVYQFNFTSVGQVDPSLFEEESLKTLLGTIARVEVLPDGRRVTAGVFHNELPLRAKSPEQRVISRRSVTISVITVGSIIVLLLFVIGSRVKKGSKRLHMKE